MENINNSSIKEIYENLNLIASSINKLNKKMSIMENKLADIDFYIKDYKNCFWID